MSLKSYLKQEAQNIRSTRNDLKKYQQEHNGCDGNFYCLLRTLVYNYRHHHIAYSLLRGKKYESIEKPAENNKPNFQFIQEIQNEHTKNVCIGA
jgi:hypothetical protein